MRGNVWGARPRDRRVPAGLGRCLGVAVLTGMVLSTLLPAAEPLEAIKLSIAQDGVYRVLFENLRDAGLAAEALDTATLGLTVAGRSVPIWIEDGGDGDFGAGDWFEFVGESPRGEVAYHHEYAGLNVYWLRQDAPEPRRLLPAVAQAVPVETQPSYRYRRYQHLEQDRLLLRFSKRSQEGEDLWYWAKLSHIDKQPFQLDLQLEDLDVAAEEPVTLEIGLRGWSKPRHRGDPRPPDHQVEVLLNEERVGVVEWDGQEATRFAVDIPANRLRAGGNGLVLRVPARVLAEGEDPIIDLVVLDWIAVGYPHDGTVGEGQIRLGLSESTEWRTLSLRPTAEGPLVVITSHGARAEITGSRQAGEQMSVLVAELSGAPEERSGWIDVVPAGSWLSPEAIELDVPSELSRNSQQADYIIITHSRLRAAIEPLAEFHRRRGLAVLVADIEDVYDEFNHGVLHPRAIRHFLRHAYHEWQDPAPRFVLLVGDASWDTKNPRVKKRNYASWAYRSDLDFGLAPTRGTPYAEDADRNHRNLIPTWNHLTLQGHAASDNWFVAVDGDDLLPDMAIGRLPVTKPEEVTAIVDKTIRYAAEPVVGPWRRRVIWISDGAERYDRISDEVAQEIAMRGFAAVKVKPSVDDPGNEHQRARLMAAFDDGGLLVHFVGHGGRFIWRTAPADFKNNRDLFRLEDLDELVTHPRLPIVVSMTCYSAPFDHPNSDSIGEKFLRLPGRGAVGVIAASWRIVPSHETSWLLMEELTEGGTVGEALLHAKRETDVEHFIHLFNLLGDPALPISVPAAGITVELVAEDTARMEARFDAEPFAGRAIIDWLSAGGEVLESQTLEVDDERFGSRFEGDPDDLALVRVYVWNEELGIDGVGSLRLAPRGVGPTADTARGKR